MHHSDEASLSGLAIEPVPAQPTVCRLCGAHLAPLRRYAGLCRACIMAGARPAQRPTSRAVPLFVELGRSYRRRPDGRKERYVQIQCTCGRRRTLKLSTWEQHKPRCCNRCRLRDIDALGFKAEGAVWPEENNR
jgi:hypothetical protein